MPGVWTIAKKEFTDHVFDRKLTPHFNIFTISNSKDASQMEKHGYKRTWMLVFPYCLFLVGVAGSLLSEDNALAAAVVRVIGILLLPATIGFGWKYVIDVEENKIEILTKWCIYSTLFYPAVLFIRIDPTHLGMGGIALAVISLALVAVYLRSIHLRNSGDTITVLLLLAYFTLFYLLFLENLDYPGQFIGIASSISARFFGMDEAGANTLLQLYLTDLCFTGVIASITAHVFMLDLINKVKEYVLAEETLDEPTDTAWYTKRKSGRMPGLLIIAKKEFTDHISDRTFLLCFGILLVAMVSGALYQVESLQNYRYTIPYPTWMADPNKLQLLTTYQLSSLGALLALTLSFNSINKERTEGSLKVLLSYPIYRDKIIIGKLLGGVAVVAISVFSTMAISYSIVIYQLSLPITADLLLRIIGIAASGIVLLTFFLCLGTAVSTVVRDTATSLMILLIALSLMQGEPLAMMLVMASTLVPGLFKSPENLALQYGPEWLRWGTTTSPLDIQTFRDYVWPSPIESFRHLSTKLFQFWTIPYLPNSGSTTFLSQLVSNIDLAVIPMLYAVAAFIACYILFTRRDVA